jgi:hypothetical protein
MLRKEKTGLKSTYSFRGVRVPAGPFYFFSKGKRDLLNVLRITNVTEILAQNRKKVEALLECKDSHP